MTSYVYFAKSGDRIKIGYSTNVAARMKAVGAYLEQPVEVLGVCRGGAVLERDLHNRLARHRLRGEWFADCEEVRAVIGVALNATTSSEAGDRNERPSRGYAVTRRPEHGADPVVERALKDMFRDGCRAIDLHNKAAQVMRRKRYTPARRRGLERELHETRETIVSALAKASAYAMRHGFAVDVYSVIDSYRSQEAA